MARELEGQVAAVTGAAAPQTGVARGAEPARDAAFLFAASLAHNAGHEETFDGNRGPWPRAVTEARAGCSSW